MPSTARSDNDKPQKHEVIFCINGGEHREHRKDGACGGEQVNAEGFEFWCHGALHAATVRGDAKQNL